MGIVGSRNGWPPSLETSARRLAQVVGVMIVVVVTIAVVVGMVVVIVMVVQSITINLPSRGWRWRHNDHFDTCQKPEDEPPPKTQPKNLPLTSFDTRCYRTRVTGYWI